MDPRVGANTNRYGAAGWRTLLQGGAKAPRLSSNPRGLSACGFSARTSLRTPPWSAIFPRSPGFVVERVDRAPLGRVLRIRAPCRGTRRPCFSPQDSPQKPRRGVSPHTRQSQSTAAAESRRGAFSRPWNFEPALNCRRPMAGRLNCTFTPQLTAQGLRQRPHPP